MPKVNDEYVTEKRNGILECAEEILKEKPLYLITMRDIIKKSGFSQGGIYRYYSSLDEIYVEIINKHTTGNPLEQRVEALLSSEQTEKTILSECFISMGEYIEELLKSIAGKTFFELMVLYSYDFEKRAAIFPKLQFKQCLEYAQKRILEYVMSNVDKGVFCLHIPADSIIQFVSAFIDGIAQSVVYQYGAITISDGGSYDSKPVPDIPEMFQVLAKAVIGFLEV